MEQELKELNNRLTKIEDRLNGLSNDPRQVEVILRAVAGEKLTVAQLQTASFGLGTSPVGRQPDITAPSGGTTIDGQARTAISEIISTLETFGLTQ